MSKRILFLLAVAAMAIVGKSEAATCYPYRVYNPSSNVFSGHIRFQFSTPAVNWDPVTIQPGSYWQSTYTTCLEDYPNPIPVYVWYWDDGVWANAHSLGTVQLYNGGTYTYFNLPGGVQMKKQKATIQNDTDRHVNAYWTSNGVVVKTVQLAPGASDDYMFTYDGNDAPEMKWGYETAQFIENDEIVKAPDLVNVDPSKGIDIEIADAAASNSTRQVNLYGNNRSMDANSTGGVQVAFSPQAATNTAQATKEGAQAMVTALDNNNRDQLAELKRIRNAAETMTNQLGELNATNRNEAASNAVLNAQTMEALEDATNSINSTRGLPLVEGVTNALGSLGSAIGTGPGTITSGGSASVFAFEFCGTQIDLDPEAIIPGAMGMIKIMITFVLWIGMFLEGSKAIWEGVKVYATAQTGGVPDMSMHGYNVPGIAAAVAVPLILIAAWAGFLTLIVAAMSGWMGTWGFSGAKSAYEALALPAGAKYLLDAALPLDLIFAFAFARVALWVTMSKLAVIAATISRVLFGK